MQSVRDEYPNIVCFRFSFVGYRDWSDGDARIQVFDFTEDAEELKRLIGTVEAKGGDDDCEDVESSRY